MMGKKIFCLYFKQIWKTIVFAFFLPLCFLAVFSLENGPASAVLYATVLCLYVGLPVLAFSFYQFAKRYRQLEQLKKSITIHLEGLPQPESGIEKQYQDLIRILFRHQNRLARDAEQKQKDLVDYFTQWTHQIKTPIAAMRLLLQTGESKQNGDLEYELFRIEKYVEFVLQYLRFNNMGNDLVIRRNNLDDIIKKAIRKNAKLFINRRIRLSYRDLNCSVLTDEKWLLFVIEQILSNSLKYTENGSISIYLQPPAERKILVIEDTGIGIPSEDLPRVFEKGFTGQNGRTHAQSTGIGLYLCKQIMDRLSHGITIESTVGRGTRVFLDLKTKEINVE
jgi:histidine kinase (EC 2.7.13.3)